MNHRSLLALALVTALAQPALADTLTLSFPDRTDVYEGVTLRQTSGDGSLARVDFGSLGYTSTPVPTSFARGALPATFGENWTVVINGTYWHDCQLTRVRITAQQPMQLAFAGCAP